jgi:hypothetical protein
MSGRYSQERAGRGLRGARSAAELEDMIVSASSSSIASVSSPNSLDFYDAELRAHHEQHRRRPSTRGALGAARQAAIRAQRRARAIDAALS